MDKNLNDNTFKKLTDKEAISILAFKIGQLVGFIHKHNLYETYKEEFGDDAFSFIDDIFYNR